MKKITPDITLEDCAEKLSFYESVFGGEIQNKVTTPSGEMMHAELHIGPGLVLYFHDVFHYGKPVYGSVVLVLDMDSEEELRRTFAALKEGGGIRFKEGTNYGILFSWKPINPHAKPSACNLMITPAMAPIS